jgi:hypothetical protein
MSEARCGDKDSRMSLRSSGLRLLYWMFALANETGKLIEEGKDILPPDVAMMLATETVVAMSKVTGIGSELASDR